MDGRREKTDWWTERQTKSDGRPQIIDNRPCKHTDRYTDERTDRQVDKQT